MVKDRQSNSHTTKMTWPVTKQLYIPRCVASTINGSALSRNEITIMKSAQLSTYVSILHSRNGSDPGFGVRSSHRSLWTELNASKVTWGAEIAHWLERRPRDREVVKIFFSWVNMLTLTSLSVPPPCCRSSPYKISVTVSNLRRESD